MVKNENIIAKAAPPPGTLGKSELYAISLGYVIGAGILSLIGPALLSTGLSAWFAYFVSILFGLLINLPAVFITSTLRLSGGPYSLLAGLGNKTLSGIYSIAFFMQTINMGAFALTVGLYANELWSCMNPQVVGVIAITIFFITNLLGADFMAKVQKLMTWVMIASFLAYIILGLTKINQPVFEFSTPGFFRNGSKGFLAAIFLYVASTNGYLMSMSYGGVAKDATNDIPWAMLMCVPTFIVLYCGVTIVGSGVLPLEIVEGKTLTESAKYIFSDTLFVAFMVFGPAQALTSTMNSAFANNSMPIAQAAKDGWLPRGLAKQNRFGAYHRILIILYLIGIIPLVFKFNLVTIIMIINVALSSMAMLYTIAYLRLPKKFPLSWKKSKFHMPNGLYNFIVIIAFLGWLAILIYSLQTVSRLAAIILIGVFGFSIVYAIIKGKSEDIKIEVSMWPLDERESM